MIWDWRMNQTSSASFQFCDEFFAFCLVNGNAERSITAAVIGKCLNHFYFLSVLKFELDIDKLTLKITQRSNELYI